MKGSFSTKPVSIIGASWATSTVKQPGANCAARFPSSPRRHDTEPRGRTGRRQRSRSSAPKAFGTDGSRAPIGRRPRNRPNGRYTTRTLGRSPWHGEMAAATGPSRPDRMPMPRGSVNAAGLRSAGAQMKWSARSSRQPPRQASGAGLRRQPAPYCRPSRHVGGGRSKAGTSGRPPIKHGHCTP